LEDKVSWLIPFLLSLAHWCRPHWVVFSGGGRWSTKESEKTYQSLGSRTLHTFTSGAVRIQLNKDGVKVTPFVK
jgi:hypothetical protein